MTDGGQSGNRWGDHDEMLDYGYRQQFTPDHRGDEETIIRVSDFGMDAVGDSMSVVIYITDSGRTTNMCTYSTFADLGQISLIGCTAVSLTGVAGSADGAAATAVDGSRISTFLVEGDYFVGHVDASNALNLNLWRVGSTEP